MFDVNSFVYVTSADLDKILLLMRLYFMNDQLWEFCDPTAPLQMRKKSVVTNP